MLWPPVLNEKSVQQHYNDNQPVTVRDGLAGQLEDTLIGCKQARKHKEDLAVAHITASDGPEADHD